jgi:multidrug efflux pump subunit AcrA (membrane-fusion protein)
MQEKLSKRIRWSAWPRNISKLILFEGVLEMKKGVIISIIVVLVLAGVAGVGLAFGKGTGNGTSVFNQRIIYPVKAHKIEKGSIASTVSSSGKIEEVEKGEVYIETPLKIIKLYAHLNDKVTKGQKLMDLDTDELVSQLEKLKIDRNVQRLSINSPSADAEIKRAESSVNAALIALNDANEKLDNNKKLYEGNAISKSELDSCSKAVEEAQRALDNAKLNYDSAISSKNMDRKVKEENLKATDLSISDLEKKIEKLNKSIICPIGGVIVESNVQEGSFTNSTMPAFKISNTSALRIKANVSEYNMKDVSRAEGNYNW